MDTFSFAGISLYIFNQKWPRVLPQKRFDSNAVTLSEVEKRQEHLDKLRTYYSMLKPLLVECLNNDPAARPTMKIISEAIQMDKSKYAKQMPQRTTPTVLKTNVAKLQQNIIKLVSVCDTMNDNVISNIHPFIPANCTQYFINTRIILDLYLNI